MIVYRRAARVEIVAVLHGKRNVKRLLKTTLPRPAMIKIESISRQMLYFVAFYGEVTSRNPTPC
jgi:hypothetical protein